MRCGYWLTGQSTQSAEIHERSLMIGAAAVAAAPGGLDPQPIARRQLSLALRRDRLAVQQVAAGRPWAAAVPPVRGVAAALSDQGEAHRFDRLQLAHDPVAAALGAIPAASAPHRELPDQHRVIGLERLEDRKS